MNPAIPLTIAAGFFAGAVATVALGTVLINRRFNKMADDFETVANQLREDIAAQTSVIASASTAFAGLSSQLATALASAQDKGATPAQLSELTAMHTSLVGNTEALAAAVQQNTPVAAPVDPNAPTGTETQL